MRGSRPCASPSAIAGFAPVASIGTVGGAFDWLDRHFALASLRAGRTVALTGVLMRILMRSGIGCRRRGLRSPVLPPGEATAASFWAIPNFRWSGP